MAASGPLPLLHIASRPTGLVLFVIGAAMGICGIVGLATGDGLGASAMAIGALVSGLVGFLLTSWGRTAPRVHLGRREALTIVSLSWVSAGLFGGIPFMASGVMSPVDAIFESVSGFTTTGATVLSEIEHTLSLPLHLWRIGTHWLGGMGIVVLFVAIFPALGVGGKHLFHSEAPGPTNDALQPRIRDTAFALWRVYVVLTTLEVVCLIVAGMGPFEAVVHAMSTMGTGGFSTRNGSITEFQNPAVEVIIMAFMLLAGMNFGLFHDALQKRSLRTFLNNVEWRVYVGLFAVTSLLIAFQLIPRAGLWDGMRLAGFQVATVMTTTGFASADFENWPTFSKTILILLFWVGGSAGSTAGGLKIIRVVIMFQAIWGEIRRAYRPALVTPVRVGSTVIRNQLVMTTLAYGIVFALTAGSGAVVVSMLNGVDLTTAFMASLACVANVGPGFGMVGPTDNFGFLSAGTKLFLSAEMLLGRLEFFTLLALASPGFWRR